MDSCARRLPRREVCAMVRVLIRIDTASSHYLGWLLVIRRSRFVLLLGFVLGLAPVPFSPFLLSHSRRGLL